MANFKTHLIVTIVTSTILVESFLLMGYFSIYEAMIAFVLGIIGGLLPDIDSDHSTSLKWVSTILIIGMISILLENTLDQYNLSEMLLLSVIVAFFIHFILVKSIKKLSHHRGMFHSIPVAIIFGLMTTIIAHDFLHLNPIITWLYGFILTSTYLLHLITDELYSIDLKNKRLKQSFGTAFKLFRVKSTIDKLYTFFIYLLLFILCNLAPNSEMTIYSLFNQEFVLKFTENIFR